MARPPAVLVISSQVAVGPVGASVAGPALLSLGVVPIIIPTVILSNHPGHGHPAGMAMPAATIGAMLERLAALGFLAGCTTILTGYFANAEQVAIAADFIANLRARNPEIYYLCDPVVGDDGEFYVKPDVAEAIRDRLVPLAQGITPNAFEAGWLSGTTIRNLEDAKKAASHWSDKDAIITSVPDTDDRIVTAAFSHGDYSLVSRTRLSDVANGTGDLLSGLVAGTIAKGEPIARSLPSIIDTLDRVIAASQGSASLDLARGLKA